MPDFTGRTAAPRCEDSLAEQTDEQLLAGLREGSEGHFTQLYERYFRRIYTFSYARVRNEADAEEIAQETFLAVFRSIGAFRGQSSLLSWIYGIAKNTANSVDSPHSPNGSSRSSACGTSRTSRSTRSAAGPDAPAMRCDRACTG